VVEHASSGCIGKLDCGAEDGVDHAHGTLVMALAAWLYTIAMSLIRIQAIILEREYRATWIDQLELA
jgi:hypothetical protein